MLHLGTRRGTTPDPQPPAPSPVRGRRLTLSVVGAAATAVVVGFVATAAQPRDGAPDEITVVVTDAASAGAATCLADDYAGTFLDGLTVELSGEEGAVLATDSLDADGEPTALGCSWSVRTTDVEESPAYTVTLRGNGILPREHVYRRTAEDLATGDGVLSVAVIG